MLNFTEKDFFKKLTQQSHINKIILYGSRARGDAGARSDIDLAIECPLASDNDWIEILSIIENADTLIKIDVVRLDKLSNTSSLAHAISKEGIILYDKANRNKQ